MIKNYIKIAWRNLWKNNVFTACNVLGLTLAFAVALLLAMTALFELSYDQFHENKDSLYQVYHSAQTPKGTKLGTTNPVPLAPALKESVVGIKHITRLLTTDVLVSHDNNNFNLDAHYVDYDYFSMFSYPTLHGSDERPLQDKNTLVLTKTAAEKIFGDGNALGKTLVLRLNNENVPFTVSAVLKDIPFNSTYRFDVALSFENHPEYAGLTDQWNAFNHSVYLQLESGVTPEEIEQRSQAFTELHFSGEIENMVRDGAQPDAAGRYRKLGVYPYTDKHFADLNAETVKVKRTFPYMILGIAILIVFIACANFINMNIALGEKRLKEIGMRKTLGAIKGQLFSQFWMESLLVFMVSLVLGGILANVLSDPFKTLFNTRATLSGLASPALLLTLLFLVLLVTFISGGYPALLLSKLNTLKALKGKWDIGKNGLRNSLIVIQFVIAIALIAGTLVFQGQLQYMRNKDLGFNKEHVVSIPLTGKKEGHRVIALLREALRNNQNILSVSAADDNFGRGRDGSSSKSVIGFEHKGRVVRSNMLSVAYDYAQTLDLQLLEGRSFSREYGADSLNMVINEAMVKELGEEKDPLSTKIYFDEDSVAYSVIGVLKDFNFEKINKKIEPITLFLDQNTLFYAFVKVGPHQIAESYDAIAQAWKTIEPNAEFQGSFLDENLDRTFRREKNMASIITGGSVLGIILSCIGLFAMSLLVVAQRTKEIGIRKVIGASVSSITMLLTKDFLKLVCLAFVISSPIAWYLLDQWLQEYAYHVPLSLWFFVGAGLLAACIALLTIGIRTVKSALANPVKSLRTE